MNAATCTHPGCQNRTLDPSGRCHHHVAVRSATASVQPPAPAVPSAAGAAADDLDQWVELGWSEKRAREWMDVTISTSHHPTDLDGEAGWFADGLRVPRTYSFSLDDAEAWYDLADGDESWAGGWARHGFTPDEAEAWGKAVGRNRNWRARAFRDLGHTPEAVSRVMKAARDWGGDMSPAQRDQHGYVHLLRHGNEGVEPEAYVADAEERFRTTYRDLKEVFEKQRREEAERQRRQREVERLVSEGQPREWAESYVNRTT